MSAGSPAPPRPARPQPAPTPFPLCFPAPGRARRAGRGLGADPGERSCGVGVGRGARGATASCKMGEPGCRRRWGGIGGESREKASGQEERALSGPFQGRYLPHLSSELSEGTGVWEGKGTARLARDLSLNAAVEAGVRCRG